MFTDEEYPEDVLSAAMWFAEGESQSRARRQRKRNNRCN
jgi:hypothetical protein